jgi:hypothetical protein
MPPPSESASVGQLLDLHRASGLEARRHRGTARHRDADHPQSRRLRLHRRGDAGDQAAARQRDQRAFEVGHRLEHLEPQRALARHHARVVEGRDHRQALLGHQPVDLDLGVVLADGRRCAPRRRALSIALELVGGTSRDMQITARTPAAAAA